MASRTNILQFNMLLCQ